MRNSLDIYDDVPREMRSYLNNYGWHFSRRACEYAVSLMRNRRGEKITMWPKERADELLAVYNITLKNNVLYDYIYVLNMAYADYWGNSIEDDIHLVRYIKDTIDDYDGGEGNIMRKWYASMIGSGEPVNWEQMI